MHSLDVILRIKLCKHKVPGTKQAFRLYLLLLKNDNTFRSSEVGNLFFEVEDELQHLQKNG